MRFKLLEPRLLWVLDNGHGGMVDGVYQTNGKRFKIGDREILEGVYNRGLVKMITLKLTELGIPNTILVPEERDVSLTERVQRVNYLMQRGQKRCKLISVHLNAGGGNGGEVHTWSAPNRVLEKDLMANAFYNSWKKLMPLPFRVNRNAINEYDWENNTFTILKSLAPTILTENGFMDNPANFDWLLTQQGRKDIVNVHIDMIINHSIFMGYLEEEK